MPPNSITHLRRSKTSTIISAPSENCRPVRDNPNAHPAKIDVQSGADESCKTLMVLTSLREVVTDHHSKPHLVPLLHRVDERLDAVLAWFFALVDVHDLDETIARLAHGIKREGWIRPQFLGEKFDIAFRTKLEKFLLRVIGMRELELGGLGAVGCLEFVALTAGIIYIEMSVRFSQLGADLLAFVPVAPGEFLLLRHLHHVVELLDIGKAIQETGLLHGAELVALAVQR